MDMERLPVSDAPRRRCVHGFVIYGPFETGEMIRERVIQRNAKALEERIVSELARQLSKETPDAQS